MQEHKQIVKEQLDWNELPVPLQTQFEDIKMRFIKGNFIEQIIIKNDSTIEGVGVSWKNSLHPTAKYIRFAGTNITQLSQSLIENREGFNKIVSSCYESNIETIEVLQRLGFELFRKTYMFTKPIREVVQFNPNSHASSVEIHTLKEIQKNEYLEESLFKLVKANYEETHLKNEVKNMTWQMWSNLLYEDHPHFEFSKVVVAEDEVIAYIFVHTLNEKEVEIGWVGKDKLHNFPLQYLLHTVLISLQTAGWVMATFEIDTTDIYAMEFTDILTIENVESWNSYIKQ